MGKRQTRILRAFPRFHICICLGKASILSALYPKGLVAGPFCCIPKKSFLLGKTVMYASEQLLSLWSGFPWDMKERSNWIPKAVIQLELCRNSRCPFHVHFRSISASTLKQGNSQLSRLSLYGPTASSTLLIAMMLQAFAEQYKVLRTGCFRCLCSAQRMQGNIYTPEFVGRQRGSWNGPDKSQSSDSQMRSLASDLGFLSSKQSWTVDLPGNRSAKAKK